MIVLTLLTSSRGKLFSYRLRKEDLRYTYGAYPYKHGSKTGSVRDEFGQISARLAGIKLRKQNQMIFET